jgi:hypothetical protein
MSPSPTSGSFMLIVFGFFVVLAAIALWTFADGLPAS